MKNNSMKKFYNEKVNAFLEARRIARGAREFEVVSNEERICSLGQAIGIDDGNADFLVVTNTDGFCGASVIFKPDVIAKLQRYLGRNFYIIPSSIHELICTRLGEDVKTYNKMIREVNTAQVAPEEQLADNVFVYIDGKGIYVGSQKLVDSLR